MILCDRKDELFEWYLAYLRKNAQRQSMSSAMTPMALIHADQELLKQLISEEAQQKKKSGLAGEEKRENHVDANFVWGCVLSVLVALIAVLYQLYVILPMQVGILFFLIRLNGTSKRLQLPVEMQSKLGLNIKDNPNDRKLLEKPQLLIDSFLDEINLMEQKERLIFEFCSLILCQMNGQGKVIRLNENAANIWGYNKTELTGADVQTILSEPAKETFSALLQSCRDKRETETTDIRVQKENGEFVDLRWRMEWSEQSNSYFCCAEDITAAKDAERLKEEMTATINHDLRAPISALDFALQNIILGSYGEISEGMQTALKRSVRNLKSVLSLLDNLLDIQRLESSTLQCSTAKLQLQDCLLRSAELVHEWCKASKLSLEISETPAIVVGDLDQICRILTNLLANAIKWTPSGGRILVRAIEQTKFVVIEVEDGGPGVPEEQKATLFQRWGTGSSPSKKYSPSVGLGLYIAKKLAELQGGAVGVRSGNPGSIFWFSLPRA